MVGKIIKRKKITNIKKYQKLAILLEDPKERKLVLKLFPINHTDIEINVITYSKENFYWFSLNSIVTVKFS